MSRTDTAASDPAGSSSDSAPSTIAGARRGGTRWAFRAVAVLLGLLLGLTGMEIALRVLDIRPSTMLIKRYLMGAETGSIYWCYPDNPHGEFRETPDVKYGRWNLRIMKTTMEEIPLERLGETPWCVEYHLSSQRLRDREYGPRPRGVLRVAGLGDSFAAGEGVPLERSLYKQMEDDLGDGYEVLNAAQPGHDTSEERRRLEVLVDSFDCRRAIVVWIANDVHRTPQLDVRQDYMNDLVLLRDERLQRRDHNAWYRRHSRLVDLVESRVHLWLLKDDLARVTSDTIEWYRDCYDPAQNAENLQAFEADLAGIAAVPGCRSVLVLYPLLEGIEGDYPLADVHAYVAEAARRVGLPVLDLAPVFKGQTTSELWVHPVDHHPNGHAHELAAAAIVAWLRREVSGFLERPTE
ncbi:MAG: SGNH/GDSL hydrolase family protein [Pirellulales bacterium]